MRKLRPEATCKSRWIWRGPIPSAMGRVDLVPQMQCSAVFSGDGVVKVDVDGTVVAAFNLRQRLAVLNPRQEPGRHKHVVNARAIVAGSAF